jgi:aldose 1-epimerase
MDGIMATTRRDSRVTIDRREFMAGAAVVLAGCTRNSQEQANKNMNRRAFGQTKDAQPVEIITLRNSNGMEAAIMTYGGVVQSLKVPSKSGAPVDVVLGFDSFDSYPTESPYFGALIGRYGNRIGDARFKLDGVEYKLPANDGKNTLHGGTKGFDKRIWTPKDVS